MTREELKAHCERQIQQFERVEKIMPVTLNDWKRYEEHNLILELLEQETLLDKVRAEIAEYGSIWVEYKITGRSDKDIEQLVSDVLKQAKEQVLDVIDKYKEESESEE